MKIKRYLDKDMRHVLRRVREDQGPDAVILSNRRVDDGIEVIAAIDYDEALVRHAVGLEVNETSSTDGLIDSDVLAEIAEDDFVPGEASASAPEVLAAEVKAQSEAAMADRLAQPIAEDQQTDSALKDVQDEITSLRGLIETQLSGLVWKDSSGRSPHRAQVLRNLAKLGIAPDVAHTILDRLPPITNSNGLWHAPLKEVADMMPLKPDGLLEQGGTFALIGPTGVGKTTTIAKLATRFALTHGADEIALISADSYRIGAKEHLMAFANIIGAKVYSASTAEELTDLLFQLRSKKLVLIDTEGRSPRDRDLTQQLAAYGSNQDRVRFYLTLSAATQEASLDEAIRSFNKVPLEGCIVTKIDEAAQLGCVISTLIRHDLPACWFSDGQHIPDDLRPASKRKYWLINQAIDCLKTSKPRVSERSMAENYSTANIGHA
ncbi:MAG: flagellar biosynthesis protein FlhF [Woeseiaceae bacterium]|nr:flagellar biosynthesis protein FlhF [Woeseiaceae bacterium]